MILGCAENYEYNFASSQCVLQAPPCTQLIPIEYRFSAFVAKADCAAGVTTESCDTSSPNQCFSAPAGDVYGTGAIVCEECASTYARLPYDGTCILETDCTTAGADFALVARDSINNTEARCDCATQVIKSYTLSTTTTVLTCTTEDV